MTLTTVLLVAAALVGVGLYGALSQQSFVMLMMASGLLISGVLLAGVGLWRSAAGGGPEGQVLVVVVMFVMAIEMVIGFALVIAVFRTRQADTTEGVGSLSR